MKRKFFAGLALAAIVVAAVVNLYLSGANASSADNLLLDNVEALSLAPDDF